MEPLINRCQFETSRLLTYSLKGEIRTNLVNRVPQILSPEVTTSLPDGWKNINSFQKSMNWIEDRQSESVVLLVESIRQKEVIGFIFLYEVEKGNIRFGYLLSKEYWGQGIGSELMKGFVDWCKLDGNIKLISGGVEKINIGSIKVLEKTGFSKIDSNEESNDNLFYEYRLK